MRLDRFDLNLLVAFHALMEERSVTRAAERLHLTQPAMSAALRRLRESFNDPLLVANGKQMVPSPHAQELAPRVAEIVASSQALISGSTLFDPQTSRRRFRIAASDYVTSIAVQPLLAEMAVQAPGIRFSVIGPHANVSEQMERGEVDCIISPEQFQAHGHPSELLFEEEHVVLGWRENPLFAQPITEAAYQAAGHVVVELSNTPAFVEQFVRARGDTRRIEVTVTSFTLVPWLLPGTMRIALVHARLARLFLDKLPLAMAPPPFALPKMREMIQFNRARAADRGLLWLREGLRRHAGDPVPLR
ncbi:LysR family transcriptional regulator [uncultured Sphingomonas sp.]|uniref:LysR family transcriptional regulator n=1 Tax=uncultured Sphingomonas sp. TaxID=158754 RepID=UPI0025D883D1|nr:LysR family transcriptional regulator [uncultured Sphingomonas sp.]